MPTVILDTDFLSSFLKIGRCNLIRSFYQVEQAIIPAAVHRELAQTDLLTSLLACKMTGLVDPERMAQIIQDLRDKDFYLFKSEVHDALLE
jgi:predicted nucleic acid-binding protein